MDSYRRTAAILVGVTALWSAVLLPQPANAQEVRVAVIQFENNSAWHWWGDRLGDAAADELATQLVQSGAFTVIERRQLDAILAEQGLGQSGAVTAQTAAEVGRLLGAQLVITGSITQFSIETKGGSVMGFGASYSEAESIIDARMVDTSTGEILVVAEGEGTKRFGGARYQGTSFEQSFDAGVAQEALRPAVEEAVEQFLEQRGRLTNLAPAVSPGLIVGSRDGSMYIDRGEGHGVAIGQRFDVMRVVDEITDASGNVLDRVTEKVGTLEVTRVLAQSSICSIVEGEAAEGDAVQPAQP